MQASGAAGRTGALGWARARLGGRWLTYAVFAVLLFAPVLVFTVLGVEASSDTATLTGAGGPLLAYSAGVLSFASPCVLPIVPIYLTNLAGGTVEDGRVVVERRRIMSHSVAFLGGFSLVFIALGASVGLIGYGLRDNQETLELGAGLLMIVMGALLVPAGERRSLNRMAVYLLVVTGVFFVVVQLADIREDTGRVLLLAGALFVAWLKLAGIIQFSLLARTAQINVGQGRDIGYVRSSLIGGAFASGWTPCLGPILGAILGLASTRGDALSGAYLLGAYSLGFSVPFLLFGWVFADNRNVVRRMSRFMPWFEVASALMLIAIGLLLVSGRLTALNEYFDLGLVNEGL